MVFLVDARRITATITAVVATEARRTMWSVDHQDFSRRVAAITFGCGLHGTSRQIEQVVESFVGLDCRDLLGGRMKSHRVFHPPLKLQPTKSLAAANSGREDTIGADRY